jgi:putative hydrolases of HD superfamily
MSVMQPIDPDDPRRPNVQIAASIRAAILTEEFSPGERLPAGKDLAAHFGVSPMTVQNAIRTLRDEGFVDTRAGSGVYVRAQADLPVDEGTSHPLNGVATFLYEMGHMKHLPRAGWLMLGVSTPESVAEHSFRVGLVGINLAAIAGADIAKTATLCLIHDTHETRIGDVPSVGRAYVQTATPETVTVHQTSNMPAAAATALRDLVEEYEANTTAEAQLAHDADKLETLLQAMEYESRGYRTGEWKETSLAALRTDVGKQLAQAIQSIEPGAWWAMFAASYHEPRASTRASRTPPQNGKQPANFDGMRRPGDDPRGP